MKQFFTPWDFGGVPQLLRGWGFNQTRVKEEADLIVFTGGADIDPSFYNQRHHSTTHNYPERDQSEKQTFEWAVKHHKPIFGICRGAQLICALEGGKLWQNVNRHAGHNHNMFIGGYGEPDGLQLEVSSLHHQMMRPSKQGDIVGFSRNISTYREDDKETNIDVDYLEPEAVVWWEINAFAVQGHPEFMPRSAFADWCGGVVNEDLHYDQK